MAVCLMSLQLDQIRLVLRLICMFFVVVFFIQHTRGDLKTMLLKLGMIGHVAKKDLLRKLSGMSTVVVNAAKELLLQNYAGISV